jgi:hypothetical protein
MPKCAWDTNYQKLEQFAKEHGHCNVPFSGEFRHLAKWATRIKNKYKTKPTSVTQTQLEKLNRIGFDWSSQKDKDDQHWNEMYQRLVSFKAKTGHCSVPIGYGKVNYSIANTLDHNASYLQLNFWIFYESS